MAEGNPGTFTKSSNFGYADVTGDNTSIQGKENIITKTYVGVEAATIDHFCKAALRDISVNGFVSKYSKTGDTVDKVEIKYRQRISRINEKQLMMLDEEILSFSKEDLAYKDEDGGKMDTFIKVQKQRSDILFYNNYTTKKVYVVGPEYDTVSSGLHEIKVHIETNRLQLSTTALGMPESVLGFESFRELDISGSDLEQNASCPVSLRDQIISGSDSFREPVISGSDSFRGQIISGSDSFRGQIISGSDSFRGQIISGSDLFRGQIISDSNSDRKNILGELNEPQIKSDVFRMQGKIIRHEGDHFGFETLLQHNFKLKVYQASITQLNVETIVNEANNRLNQTNDVSRVIAVAAGKKLDQECSEYIRRYGNLQVGENCVTTAGYLTKYKSVIHAVGPQWNDYRDKVECMDHLYDTVWNVLDTCNTKSYFSVGMPSISAGIYGVPKELCADMYVKAAVDFSDKKTPFPKELHIIDVDTSILKLVQESVVKWQKNLPIDQKVTVPKFFAKHPELDVGGWNTSNQGGRKDFKGQDHSMSRDYNYGNTHDSYGNDHKGHGRHGQGYSDRNYGNNNDGGHHNRDQGHGRHEKGHKGRSESSQHHRNSDLDISRKSQFYDEQIYCSVDIGPVSKTSWLADEHCFYIDSCVLVKVYKGSIDKMRYVDAVVCANDKHLSSKEYIANSLKKAGGRDYEQALTKMEKKHLMNIKTNDVFKCSAGNMRVKFVLHVVQERFQFASNKELELYREGIESFLKKANRNNLKKLAIPLIGTGEVQHDDKKLELCCKAFVRAIHIFCSGTRDNHIAEIHLVNSSETVCKALVTVWNKAADNYGSSSKPERRGSSPADHVSSGSVSTSLYTVGRGHESGATGHSEQSVSKFKDSYRGNSDSYSGTRNNDSFRDLSGSQRGNHGRSLTEEDMETDDHAYEEIGGDYQKTFISTTSRGFAKNKKGNLNIIMD